MITSFDFDTCGRSKPASNPRDEEGNIEYENEALQIAINISRILDMHVAMYNE